MDPKLKEELKVIFEGLKLDEASLDKVLTLFENTVNSKVKIATDIALNEQDAAYAKELQNLITKLDEKHSAKLDEVINVINENHAMKLQKIQKLYENHYQKEFKKFKNNLVKTNESFIEMYINKVMPDNVISEAVTVRKQAKLISEMKKMLALDSASTNDVIKEGVLEAGKIINESKQQIEQLISEKAELENKIKANERDILLNNKLNSVEASKRDALKRIFKDADINTINENFDYSSKLIDKQRKELKEELKNKNISQKKFIPFNNKPSIIAENAQQKPSVKDTSIMNDYLSELTSH